LAGGGWYSSGDPLDIDGMQFTIRVTHSRLIAEHKLAPQQGQKIEALDDVLKIRAEVKEKLDHYLQRKITELEKLDFIKKKFPEGLKKPFIFTYPLIILDEDTSFYKDVFCKESDEDWKDMPWDASTTCFFAVLPDTGGHLWWKFWKRDKRVPMRISGASIIMGSSSNRFLHRVINLVYYGGLYRMTRIGDLPKDNYIFQYGLEQLLERQGEEISNVFTQRTTEERLERLNIWLIVLTAFVAFIAIASIVIEIISRL
jgi:hypothetical protein